MTGRSRSSPTSGANAAVLEQALKEERRSPRMDGQLAACRLQPQPQEPAAGGEQSALVDGAGAQDDGAG